MFFDTDEHVVEGEVGFEEIVADAEVLGFEDGVAILDGGEEDDGEVFVMGVLAHGREHGDAVHAGHGDVEEDEGEFFFLLAGFFECGEGFEAVGCADGFVAFEAESGGDGLATDGGVVDNKNAFHGVLRGALREGEVFGMEMSGMLWSTE